MEDTQKNIEEVFGVAPELHVPSDHPPKKPKTPSQVLRAVLFRLWEREVGPKREDFEDYYRRAMERIINAEKGKLCRLKWVHIS